MSGSESLKRIFFGKERNPKVDGHERLPGISTVAGGSTGYPGRRSSRLSGSRSRELLDELPDGLRIPGAADRRAAAHPETPVNCPLLSSRAWCRGWAPCSFQACASTSPLHAGELKRGSRLLFRREHSSGVSFPVSSMVATYPVRPSGGMRFTRNGFGFEKIS